MTRKLGLFILALVSQILHPTLLHSQDQTKDSNALKAFEQLVIRNPRAASYGDMSFTEELRIEEVDSCSIKMVTISDFGGRSHETLSLDVDLNKYSPAIAIKKWDSDELWSVKGYTSSGKDETHLVRTGTYPIDGYRNFFELVFGREAVAHQAAGLLKEAIAKCGGKETLAATAASKKQNEASPEAVELYPSCQKMVSSQLRSPNTAAFADVGSLLVVKDEKEGTLSLSGKVTGQNAYGGSVTSTFICQYERAGDSWVPSGRPIIL
jgi:hypothetical protein